MGHGGRGLGIGAVVFSWLVVAIGASAAPQESPPPQSQRPPAERPGPGGEPPAGSGTQTAQSASLPASPPLGTFSTEAFQTDLFTGAATAAIPIVVPQGAAGIAPQMALTYHSGVADEIAPEAQGQNTGFGWTLDVGGFIVRDTKGTTSTTDDTFTLVFAGVTHTLVLIDAATNTWHTKDELFVRLQYDAGQDRWVLTTKDGVTHRYGGNAASRAVALGPDLLTPITYKYLLDEVKTPKGVAVVYSYVKHTALAAGTGRSYDQAVYPDTITWASVSGSLLGAARTVRFVREPRGDWTDTSPDTGMAFFERERIKDIEVTLGGARVRRYRLGYDYSIDRRPATPGRGAPRAT